MGAIGRTRGAVECDKEYCPEPETGMGGAMSRYAVAAGVVAVAITGVGLALSAIGVFGSGEDAEVGGWQMESVSGTLSPEERASLGVGADVADVGSTSPVSPPALTLRQRKALEGEPSPSHS